MKRRALWLVPAFMMLSLAGCAVRAAYVTVPPPPPRFEAFGAAPGPGYVWVNGYWNWGGSRYVWAPGYWARPPRHNARWVSSQWVHRDRGYRFVPGHWR